MNGSKFKSQKTPAPGHTVCSQSSGLRFSARAWWTPFVPGPPWIWAGRQPSGDTSDFNCAGFSIVHIRWTCPQSIAGAAVDDESGQDSASPDHVSFGERVHTTADQVAS